MKFKLPQHKKNVLILFSEKKYNEQFQHMISNFLEQNTSMCFVCIARPHHHIMKNMDKKHNKRIQFVETFGDRVLITKGIDCHKVSSPYAVDEIISSLYNFKHDLLVIDCVCSLLNYLSNHEVLSFINQISSLDASRYDKKVMLLVLEGHPDIIERKKKLHEDMVMFMDHVVDIR